MKEIHIGKEIHEVFINRGLTITEFAKRINKSRENVYNIFTRKSIDTDLLLVISDVLRFDFFLLYIITSKDKEEIENLKKEVDLLREINELLKVR
jgi:transcriptional regulator with XRE-family HTH domain